MPKNRNSRAVTRAAFELSIDWQLLHEQKQWLLGHLGADEAEGLLSLLDGIQDYAVDKLGLDEVAVFGPDLIEKK